ncbi:MAG: polysaccharide pyruvyl transferase family protein, partial [Candidatus Peribacteraceae bacterium]|nr:polysaccharide pyruvyl transferase family protein [Candidatus Peribacteraceae bacterium]
SVRDEESQRRDRGGDRDRVILSFDPVLSLFDNRSNVASTSTVLVVIPRMNSGVSFTDAVQSAVKELRPSAVRILSMQPDFVEEQRVCASLAASVGSIATVHPVRSLQELTAMLRDCGHLVTGRYHGALAGLALGVPMDIIPQRDGDKLSALKDLSKNSGAPELLRERVRTGEHSLQKFINMLK